VSLIALLVRAEKLPKAQFDQYASKLQPQIELSISAIGRYRLHAIAVQEKPDDLEGETGLLQLIEIINDVGRKRGELDGIE